MDWSCFTTIKDLRYDNFYNIQLNKTLVKKLASRLNAVMIYAKQAQFCIKKQGQKDHLSADTNAKMTLNFSKFDLGIFAKFKY